MLNVCVMSVCVILLGHGHLEGTVCGLDGGCTLPGVVCGAEVQKGGEQKRVEGD